MKNPMAALGYAVALRPLPTEVLAALSVGLESENGVPKENMAFESAVRLGILNCDGFPTDIEALRFACASAMIDR